MTGIRVEWAQCNIGRQSLKFSAYAEEKKGVEQDGCFILIVCICQTGKGNQGWNLKAHGCNAPEDVLSSQAGTSAKFSEQQNLSKPLHKA